MSSQITTEFVQQYTNGIESTVQQRTTRLRRAVDVETGVKGKQAFFDQVGATAAVEATTRHDDTPQIDTPHARRMVPMRTFRVADLIDDADKVRVLNDPTNAYSQSMAMAMGRQIDDLIIEAALGTASTGETGSTSTSFDTANMQIASSSAGLTLTKIIQAREKLLVQENDPDEPWYFTYQARQLRDLLNDTTITSADYNSVKALVKGEIDTFMGFEWIHSERLGTASSERRCFAWRKGGLKLAIGEDVKGRISERDDKNYSTQIWFEMVLGSTRMQELSVVEILCTE